MQTWTLYNPGSTPRQLLWLNFTSFFEMGWGAIAAMHLDGFTLWLELPYSSPLLHFRGPMMTHPRTHPVLPLRVALFSLHLL